MITKCLCTGGLIDIDNDLEGQIPAPPCIKSMVLTRIISSNPVDFLFLSEDIPLVRLRYTNTAANDITTTRMT